MSVEMGKVRENYCCSSVPIPACSSILMLFLLTL